MIARLNRLAAICLDWCKVPGITDAKTIRVGRASDGRLFIGMPFAIVEPVPDLADKRVRFLACNLTREDAEWLAQALQTELNKT